MTTNLLVGVAETAEVTAPRRFLVDLLGDLRSVGVHSQVAAFAPGPVVDALAAVSAVEVLRPLPRRSPAALVEGAVRRRTPALARRVLGLRTRSGRRRLVAPDVIHLHGALAMPLLRFVTDPDVPVTVFVHPWDFSIAGLPPRDRRELVARTTRFLAADDSVVAPLLDAGVAPERITRVDARVPRLPELPPSTGRRAEARGELGMAGDRPVVAVLPVPDWALLPDPTLDVAWEVERRSGRPPAFAWFGVPDPDDHERRWPIDHELAHLGLGHVELRGEPPAWDELVELADAVVLPSVATDLPTGFARAAARRATPLLCWSDHPGAGEVAGWGGTVVAAGDARSMARCIIETFETPDTLRRARQAAWRPCTAEIERLVGVAPEVP